jgi:protein involved in polysaccharide export with SLBB domain
MSSHQRAGTALALFSLVVLSLPGCSTNAPKLSPPLEADLAPVDPNAQPEYRLHVGDGLSVKFFFNPELNEEIVVRPDGRISLQLIPEVVAAGRTTAELAATLRELYSGELERPEIAVIVRASAQRVFVDGEVEKPGEVLMDGPLTMLQAVTRAGGPTDRARLEQVILIRRNEDGTPRAMAVDLEAAREGIDLAQSLPLAAYDVVYLPRSAITNVNVWVDQYIRQNIPINFGFRFPF